MEVITIESQAYKTQNKRLENMEQMLLALMKIVMNLKQEQVQIQPEFITREMAVEEFKISNTTVGKKLKKYNVTRLRSGGKNLLNRQEFIKTLAFKEPPPELINRDAT